MNIVYYQTNSGFIAVTNESPKGFRDVLFAGKGGPLNAIKEEIFEASALQKMKRVAVQDVPAEWVTALGYEEPIEIPLLDPETNDLMDYIPVRRTEYFPGTTPPAVIAGMLIGLAVVIYFLVF